MPCNHCHSTVFTPLFTLKGYELVRCGDCGLAYIINPPSADELKRIYSAESNYHVQLHDPASDTWRSFERLAEKHMAFVSQQIGGGRVLDVGCSTGHFLALARQRGFEVAGAEFSPDSAKVARAHFGLEVTGGSIHDVAAPDGAFDLVTMFDVIEHVPDPAADIAKAFQLVKPGGSFVLSTPNIDGLFPRLSLPPQLPHGAGGSVDRAALSRRAASVLLGVSYIQRERIHCPADHFLDHLGRLRIGPLLFRHRVEPHRGGIGGPRAAATPRPLPR
jgi:2-polyprenyl-3-methyl-5-hydroxy-6-metoxy-1,4-benzoquinol methylase